MSDKELLYIDDTLGHLKQLQSFLTDYKDEVEDEELTTNIDKVLKETKKLHGDFLSLLKE